MVFKRACCAQVSIAVVVVVYTYYPSCSSSSSVSSQTLNNVTLTTLSSESSSPSTTITTTVEPPTNTMTTTTTAAAILRVQHSEILPNSSRNGADQLPDGSPGFVFVQSPPSSIAAEAAVAPSSMVGEQKQPQQDVLLLNSAAIVDSSTTTTALPTTTTVQKNSAAKIINLDLYSQNAGKLILPANDAVDSSNSAAAAALNVSVKFAKNALINGSDVDVVLVPHPAILQVPQRSSNAVQVIPQVEIFNSSQATTTTRAPLEVSQSISSTTKADEAVFVLSGLSVMNDTTTTSTTPTTVLPPLVVVRKQQQVRTFPRPLTAGSALLASFENSTSAPITTTTTVSHAAAVEYPKIISLANDTIVNKVNPPLIELVQNLGPNGQVSLLNNSAAAQSIPVEEILNGSAVSENETSSAGSKQREPRVLPENIAEITTTASSTSSIMTSTEAPSSVITSTQALMPATFIANDTSNVVVRMPQVRSAAVVPAANREAKIALQFYDTSTPPIFTTGAAAAVVSASPLSSPTTTKTTTQISTTLEKLINGFDIMMMPTSTPPPMLSYHHELPPAGNFASNIQPPSSFYSSMTPTPPDSIASPPPMWMMNLHQHQLLAPPPQPPSLNSTVMPMPLTFYHHHHPQLQQQQPQLLPPLLMMPPSQYDTAAGPSSSSSSVMPGMMNFGNNFASMVGVVPTTLPPSTSIEQLPSLLASSPAVVAQQDAANNNLFSHHTSLGILHNAALEPTTTAPTQQHTIDALAVPLPSWLQNRHYHHHHQYSEQQPPAVGALNFDQQQQSPPMMTAQAVTQADTVTQQIMPANGGAHEFDTRDVKFNDNVTLAKIEGDNKPHSFYPPQQEQVITGNSVQQQNPATTLLLHSAGDYYTEVTTTMLPLPQLPSVVVDGSQIFENNKTHVLPQPHAYEGVVLTMTGNDTFSMPTTQQQHHRVISNASALHRSYSIGFPDAELLATAAPPPSTLTTTTMPLAAAAPETGVWTVSAPEMPPPPEMTTSVHTPPPPLKIDEKMQNFIEHKSLSQLTSDELGGVVTLSLAPATQRSENSSSEEEIIRRIATFIMLRIFDKAPREEVDGKTRFVVVKSSFPPAVMSSATTPTDVNSRHLMVKRQTMQAEGGGGDAGELSFFIQLLDPSIWNVSGSLTTLQAAPLVQILQQLSKDFPSETGFRLTNIFPLTIITTTEIPTIPPTPTTVATAPIEPRILEFTDEASTTSAKGTTTPTPPPPELPGVTEWHSKIPIVSHSDADKIVDAAEPVVIGYHYPHHNVSVDDLTPMIDVTTTPHVFDSLTDSHDNTHVSDAYSNHGVTTPLWSDVTKPNSAGNTVHENVTRVNNDKLPAISAITLDKNNDVAAPRAVNASDGVGGLWWSHIVGSDFFDKYQTLVIIALACGGVLVIFLITLAFLSLCSPVPHGSHLLVSSSVRVDDSELPPRTSVVKAQRFSRQSITFDTSNHVGVASAAVTIHKLQQSQGVNNPISDDIIMKDEPAKVGGIFNKHGTNASLLARQLAAATMSSSSSSASPPMQEISHHHHHHGSPANAGSPTTVTTSSDDEWLTPVIAIVTAGAAAASPPTASSSATSPHGGGAGGQNNKKKKIKQTNSTAALISKSTFVSTTKVTPSNATGAHHQAAATTNSSSSSNSGRSSSSNNTSVQHDHDNDSLEEGVRHGEQQDTRL